MRWRAATLVLMLGVFGLVSDDVDPSRVAMTVGDDGNGVLDP